MKAERLKEIPLTEMEWGGYKVGIDALICSLKASPLLKCQPSRCAYHATKRQGHTIPLSRNREVVIASPDTGFTNG